MGQDLIQSKQKVQKRIAILLQEYRNMKDRGTCRGIQKMLHDELQIIAGIEPCFEKIALDFCIELMSNPPRETGFFSRLTKKWKETTLSNLPLQEQKKFLIDFAPQLEKKSDLFFTSFFNAPALYLHPGADTTLQGTLLSGETISSTFSETTAEAVLVCYDGSTASFLEFIDRFREAVRKKTPLILITKPKYFPFIFSRRFHDIECMLFVTENPVIVPSIKSPIFYAAKTLFIPTIAGKDTVLIAGYDTAAEKRTLSFLARKHSELKERIINPLHALIRLSNEHPEDMHTASLFAVYLERHYKEYPQFSYSRWETTLLCLGRIIKNLLSIEVMITS